MAPRLARLARLAAARLPPKLIRSSAVVALIALAACGKTRDEHVKPTPAPAPKATTPDGTSCAVAPSVNAVSATFAAGRLWVVAQSGGLYSYDPDLRTYRAHFTSASITRVVAGPRSVFAFENFGGAGIHSFDERGRETYGFPVVVKDEVFDAAPWDLGVAFIGRHDAVFVSQSGQVRTRPLTLAEGRRTVASTHDGRLHVGTEGGAMQRIAAPPFYESEVPARELGPIFGEPVVTAITIDPDNERSRCVYAAVVNGRKAGDVVTRYCEETSERVFARVGEDIRSLAARQGTLLAVGNELHLITSGPTVTSMPFPRSAHRCGLEVVTLDEFWVFPIPKEARPGPRDPQYIAVAKP